MFTDDLDEAIYQARLAARRRDEHIRAEGAINALDVAEPRIRELEAKVAALEAKVKQGPCCREPWCEGECTCKVCAPDLALRDLEAERDVLEAENGRLRTALDIISNHGVQYPWPECARIARAALAQQPNPAQDKEQA